MQKWHSKDLQIAFTAEFEFESGIQHWLDDSMKQRSVREMPRPGRPLCAFAFDRIGLQHLDRLILYPEQLHGHWPNLDLLNVVTSTVYHHGGTAGINPHLYTGEPIDGTMLGLGLYSWNAALSVPRTSAAQFARYEIHAIGLSTYTQEPWEQLLLNPFSRMNSDSRTMNTNPHNFTGSRQHFEAIGNVASVVMHHMQNVDELLHQSFDTWGLLGAVDFFENQHSKTLIPVIVALLLVVRVVVDCLFVFFRHLEHSILLNDFVDASFFRQGEHTSWKRLGESGDRVCSVICC